MNLNLIERMGPELSSTGQSDGINPIDKYVRKIDNSTCTYCPDYQQASNGR